VKATKILDEASIPKSQNFKVKWLEAEPKAFHQCLPSGRRVNREKEESTIPIWIQVISPLPSTDYIILVQNAFLRELNFSKRNSKLFLENEIA